MQRIAADHVREYLFVFPSVKRLVFIKTKHDINHHIVKR